jgi:hypothetical protein
MNPAAPVTTIIRELHSKSDPFLPSNVARANRARAGDRRSANFFESVKAKL